MKKIIFYILLITSVIIFSTTQYCYAINLLADPSFEEGDFPLDNWGDWSGAESGNPGTDGVAGFPTPREVSHSGNKGVGKILYGTGERWGGFSQTVNVTDGKIFNASGWVKNSKNDGALGRGARAYIEVKFLDKAESEIKKVKSGSIRGSTNWTKLSAKGTIPGKAKKAIFSFVLVGPAGSHGKVLFDDASLNVRD